jgi:hypothetical protein
LAPTLQLAPPEVFVAIAHVKLPLPPETFTGEARGCDANAYDVVSERTNGPRTVRFAEFPCESEIVRVSVPAVAPVV